MMPELDGYEVCRRIRAKDPSIPVLFVSAKNEEMDVVLGLDMGGDDFIRKPFGRRELLARIRAALRRSGGGEGRSTCFEMNGLTVYPEELRAIRDGRDIDLSPREARILSILHENAGRPVHRDVLLNECWGMEYYPESRTLDQPILNLRKRIERHPHKPSIIETVRGVGYRFRRGAAL
jgi:DNA-binding response OmpR family regulator